MIFKSAKANCNGDYVNANASSEQCESDVQEIEEVRGIIIITS